MRGSIVPGMTSLQAYPNADTSIHRPCTHYRLRVQIQYKSRYRAGLRQTDFCVPRSSLWYSRVAPTTDALLVYYDGGIPLNTTFGVRCYRPSL